MIRKLLAVLLLSFPLIACSEGPAPAAPVVQLQPAAAAAGEFDEGIDYAAVVPPLPGATAGKVKVVELFWYGCPHCFQFEPRLREWLAHKPANVEFERIPAIFNNPAWELHARAYYTADVMGVLGKVHEPLFDAIHVKKQRLDSKEALREVFVAHGVDGAEFDATFDSFAVSGLVRNAAMLTKQYAIDGVPSLAVQGKYRVGGKMAGSFDNMVNIVNFLVTKESAAK